MWGGAKYTVLDMKMSDAQYIEQADHTAENVCGIFGVPPHRVGLLKRSTNNNIEMQHIEYVQFGLQPTITNLEQEVNRKAMRISERGSIVNRINIAGLLRGDSKAQAEYIDKMMKWGVYQLDDAREYIGANPLPDGIGKRSMVPGNMNPLDRLDEIVTAQIEGKIKSNANSDGASTE
jgi:HK97 family phage portal protein